MASMPSSGLAGKLKRRKSRLRNTKLKRAIGCRCDEHDHACGGACTCPCGLSGAAIGAVIIRRKKKVSSPIQASGESAMKQSTLVSLWPGLTKSTVNSLLANAMLYIAIRREQNFTAKSVSRWLTELLIYAKQEKRITKLSCTDGQK